MRAVRLLVTRLITRCRVLFGVTRGMNLMSDEIFYDLHVATPLGNLCLPSSATEIQKHSQADAACSASLR